MSFKEDKTCNKNREKDCYCREIFCSENNFTDPRGRTFKEFIKYRGNNGNLRPHAERISWCSSSNSSKPMALLSNTNSDCFESIPESTNSTSTIYTHRRELYERGIGTENVETSESIQKLMYPDLISNETIAALNEFRLGNADSCLSLMSKYSLRQRLFNASKATYDIRHECVYPFHINSRGLLEMTTDSSGFAVCSICEMPSKRPLEKSPHVPIITMNNRNNEKVSEVHYHNIFANQDQVVDTMIPSNSLALNYFRKT